MTYSFRERAIALPLTGEMGPVLLSRQPTRAILLLFLCSLVLFRLGDAASRPSRRKPSTQAPDLPYAQCQRLQQQYQGCLQSTSPTSRRAKEDPGPPGSDRRTTYCKINNLQMVKRCNYCRQDFTFCTPDQYRYSSSLDELVHQVNVAGPLGALHGQAATLAYTLPYRVARFIARATGQTPVVTYYFMPPNNGLLGSCEQLPDNASPEEKAELNGNGTSGKQCAFMRCEMGDNLAQLGNVSARYGGLLLFSLLPSKSFLPVLSIFNIETLPPPRT